MNEAEAAMIMQSAAATLGLTGLTLGLVIAALFAIELLRPISRVSRRRDTGGDRAATGRRR